MTAFELNQQLNPYFKTSKILAFKKKKINKDLAIKLFSK